MSAVLILAACHGSPLEGIGTSQFRIGAKAEAGEDWQPGADIPR